LKFRASVTRSSVLRYQLGMRHNLAWSSGLAALSLVIACGETSNLVGEDPIAGSSGAGSTAGKSSGGTAAGGGASGGAAPGGAQSTGGSNSLAGSAGKAPTAGSHDPGNCTKGDGNWVTCDSGVVHREKPGTCTSSLPRPQPQPATATGLDECTSDSECTEKPNGYCHLPPVGFVPVEPHNVCSYGCTTDADCGVNQACRCGDGIGNCVSSRGCLSDQDCDGTLCSRYDACPGVPTYDFACQDPADQCQTGQDCTEPGEQFCALEGEHRACAGVVCQAAAP
jgi:hypothetical protein